MNATVALSLSIIIASVAQVLLRRGMRVGAAQRSARSVGWWLHLVSSPWVWGYMVCFAAAMGLWILALSRADLSYAFPLLSAGYIVVALLSRFLLNEALGWRRLVAIAVISVGVAIIVGS
jgi:drug/metabolite transporter (DMT)-like permease